MSLPKRGLPIAATLVLTLSLVAVAAGTVRAATPACGPDCISIFSRFLGSYADPTIVETVLGGVARLGQPVILAPANAADPAQDFIPDLGTVNGFFQKGLVSAAVNEHYHDLGAAQIEFAPHGQSTRLCVGLPSTASQGQGLTLQPCSVSARTIWIVESPAYAPGFFTIVNGSTTDFAHPFAMSYPHDQQANPDRLQQIIVRRLQYLGPSHTIADRQLWGFHFGIVP